MKFTNNQKYYFNTELSFFIKKPTRFFLSAFIASKEIGAEGSNWNSHSFLSESEKSGHSEYI